MIDTEYLYKHIDAIISVILFWFVIGVVMDAHIHIYGAALDFFSLEHAVFYTAFGTLTAIFMLFLYNGWRDGDMLGGIPDGHRLTVVGLLVFLVGGVADMIWHTLFGFEPTAEAIYSPPHMLLYIGAVLFGTGPLRRTWNSSKKLVSWKDQFPTLTSAALLLFALKFVTMHSHAVIRPSAAIWYDASLIAGQTEIGYQGGFNLGITGIILQSIFLAALILLLVDNYDIVPGGFTYILGISTAAMTYISGFYILLPAFIVGGIAADILYQRWNPSTDTTRLFRLFAFLVPAITYAAYFLTLIFTGGIVWTVHLWAGAIFLAGIAGLLTSYVIKQ